MRQRRLKNIEEWRETCRHYMVEDPRQYKGQWRSLYGENKENVPFFLEFGCGKGAFLVGKAQENPDALFLGIEGQETVAIKAAQKLLDSGLDNVLITKEYIREISEYFDNNELDGLYLNFSDPWPKKKHAKRRLTYRENLKKYAAMIKAGGFIEIKTDNDGLFEFTVEELSAVGFDIAAITTDLHNSAYNAGNIMTEYEEKFAARGKNIYYIRVEF